MKYSNIIYYFHNIVCGIDVKCTYTQYTYVDGRRGWYGQICTAAQVSPRGVVPPMLLATTDIIIILYHYSLYYFMLYNIYVCGTNNLRYCCYNIVVFDSKK